MSDEKILLIGLEIIFADALTVALRERGVAADVCIGAEAPGMVGQGYWLLLIDATADLDTIAKLKLLCPDIVVIILADAETLPPPTEIIRLGGDDYFIKSCDIEHLLFRIDSCLQHITTRKKILVQDDQLQTETATKTAAKEELRQCLKFYKTLIDSIGQSLYVVDVDDFTVKLANRACPFYDNYQGKTCHELTHEKDSPCDGLEHPCTILEIKKTGKPVTVEHVHVNAKGENIIVEVHAFPIFDDNGKLVQVVEHCIDTSERHQLQKQLRHAQKMESIATMAAGISHDFNNILTVILGFSDLAHSLLEDDNEAQAYLLEVIKAGRRARDLISQILSFSREAELSKRPVLLNPIVKETLKLLRASLPSTIELRFNIDPACGRVMAEPAQIHQVLMNICSNAFQAMELQGGVLEVDMERLSLDGAEVMELGHDLHPGKYVLLRVSDTGIGMDSATIDRIFEPYFSTKAQGQGSGLGLSVAHGIIAAHGGEILVSSEHGKGTVFSIYLPEIASDVEQDGKEKLPIWPRGSEHIVFVDDEGSIASLGRKILERLGYRVTVFTDSFKALAAIRSSSEKFDLLISDFTMPGMTGLGLVEKIKQGGIKLPVIIISGYSMTPILLEKADELGVQAVLKKPFEKSHLAKALREALAVEGS